MRWGRGLGIAAATLVVAATPGCGLGPGEASEGEATLRVTRDYGSELVAEARESDPASSETVIRFLDRETEITTRYGGGFVQSIDGVEGELSAGRSRDWFFFVNGIESGRGAAEVSVRGGDRIWWDYRDWSDALRTPAVVGSWPEPFAQAATDSERLPVVIECHAERRPCEAVADRLADERVEASVESGGEAGDEAGLRLLVGTWEAIRSDAAAATLAQDPATSGVFARFRGSGQAVSLLALDPRGEVATKYGRGAGLVAGLRQGNRPVTWVVTGTDEAGVERAAELLDSEHLADNYAVLTAPGDQLALPAGPQR